MIVDLKVFIKLGFTVRGLCIVWIFMWCFFQEVVILDPDLSKDYLDRIQNRTKERRYAFDYAFAPDSKNAVYAVYFICYLFICCSIAMAIESGFT